MGAYHDGSLLDLSGSLTTESFDGDFVALFRRRLHLYHGVVQREDGNYNSRRVYVTDNMLLQHLTGEIAVAFCVATKMQSTGRNLVRFAGIDIDQDAPSRLPVYEHVIQRLGLTRAAFATPGSSPSKAKVIFTFEEMVSRDAAWRFVNAVHDEASAEAPDIIPAEPKNGDLELFPKSSSARSTDAGILRILGRNPKRNGPLEWPITLDGETLDFAKIKPLRTDRIIKVGQSRQRGANVHPTWLRGLLNIEWTPPRIGGPAVIRQKLTAIALYCLDNYTTGDAKEKYVRLLRRVESNNLTLRTSTSDGRNPIGREIQEASAWTNALAKERWTPQQPSEKKIPGWGAYDAMVRYVRLHGLPPHRFYIDARTVAGLMGVALKSAQESLDLCERSRLAVRVDYGTSRTNTVVDGKRKVIDGNAARWGLVGAGETVYDVIAAQIGPKGSLAAPYVAADLTRLAALQSSTAAQQGVTECNRIVAAA